MPDSTGMPSTGGNASAASESTTEAVSEATSDASSEAGFEVGRSMESPERSAAPPAGDVYDWYVRGRELLASGDAAAAVQVLAHTVAADPDSRSARELLARAQFDSHQDADAAANFAELVVHDPVDHYAHFGLGLASRRLGDFAAAVEHLALASAMRPDLRHYSHALQAARAAAASRR